MSMIFLSGAVRKVLFITPLMIVACDREAYLAKRAEVVARVASLRAAMDKEG
jgi:hypothetical protein